MGIEKFWTWSKKVTLRNASVIFLRIGTEERNVRMVGDASTREGREQSEKTR